MFTLAFTYAHKHLLQDESVSISDVIFARYWHHRYNCRQLFKKKDLALSLTEKTVLHVLKYK